MSEPVSKLPAPSAPPSRRSPRTGETAFAAVHRAARVAGVGAVLGIALGVGGQIALLCSRSPASWNPSTYQRIVGTVMLVATFGAALGFASLLLLAIRRGKPGRIAIAGTALLGTVAAGLHIFGVVLRLVTGSHLTLSGLEYFANSGTAIAHEMGRKYGGELAAILVVSIASGLVLARVVRWAMHSARAGRRRVFEVSAFGFTSVAAIGYWFVPVPRSFALGVRQSSPEFAFASSLATSAPTGRNLDPYGTKLLEKSLESPPLEAGALWKERAKTEGDRPNVIVVTVEATNVHHLGYEGYARGTTPNLDELAAESLVAHRAYTTATHSNYAQMAILSSLFPRRGSALDMYFKLDYPRFLLHDATTSLGYEAATISSQDETWQGMKRFEDTGAPVYFHHSPDFQGEKLDIGTERVVPDEATIDHVLSWIDAERASNAPLSIYVNLQATHFPYSVPDDGPHPFAPYEPKGTFSYVDWDRDELETAVNRYDNALHYVDENVGKLVRGLEERGMIDDTILVFVADHGELFFDHDLVTHGRSLYENEARVPLLIHYPRKLQPGSVVTPVSTLDILPTILDLMGVPEHPALQGESLLPYRVDPGTELGAADPRHPAVFLNIQGWKHLDAVVCYPYKIIYDPESDTARLFDLARDPDESEDLAQALPDVAGALATTLHAQIAAQLEYHEGDGQLSHVRYAPRLLPCPEAARRKNPLPWKSARASDAGASVH